MTNAGLYAVLLFAVNPTVGAICSGSTKRAIVRCADGYKQQALRTVLAVLSTVTRSLYFVVDKALVEALFICSHFDSKRVFCFKIHVCERP